MLSLGQFRIDYIKKPRGKNQEFVSEITIYYLMAICDSDRDDYDKLVNLMIAIRDKADDTTK